MLQAATFCRSRASRRRGERERERKEVSFATDGGFVFLDKARGGGDGHREDEKCC